MATLRLLDDDEHAGQRNREREEDRWMFKNFVHDDCFGRIGIDETRAKYLKLLLVATTVLFCAQKVSCSMPGWSCEKKYNMDLFFLHFWGAFCVDLLVVFVVGRMHTRRGVDQMSLLLPCLLGSVYPSAVEELRFTHVSLSLFEMYCRWSVATWMFASVELLAVSAVLLAHFLHAHRTGNMSSLLCDLVLGFLLFLSPQFADPAFHLHHWAVAWLVAQLARFEPYWSRGAQMFFVGYYINGIAVYGRDPLLACAHVAFLNTKMGCGIGEINNATNNSQPHVYTPPQIWNCTGDYAR